MRLQRQLIQSPNRETNADVDDKTTSILRMQNDQVELLREIYRLSQLKLEGQGEHIKVDQSVWLVSVSRNPDFVGRQSIIQDLEARFASRSDVMRAAVLFGLGGVG